MIILAKSRGRVIQPKLHRRCIFGRIKVVIIEEESSRWMNLDTVIGKQCSTAGAKEPIFIGYPNRSAKLGDLNISRALPIRERRLVGPWCFLDRFGPLKFAAGKPMNVPPHPHIGLQTVSWLLEGEILHNDSLGSEAMVRPGGLNVMTAGNGISHTEETPGNNSGLLLECSYGLPCRTASGIQLLHL